MVTLFKNKPTFTAKLSGLSWFFIVQMLKYFKKLTKI